MKLFVFLGVIYLLLVSVLIMSSSYLESTLLILALIELHLIVGGIAAVVYFNRIKH